MFFNEFDLLKIKIDEEINSIDKLYIVESTLTFSGKRKELLLNINHPKIEVLIVPEKFFNINNWNEIDKAFERERISRDYPLEFIDIKDDDIFIISDLDEINKEIDIPKFIEPTLQYGITTLQQRNYYYKINLQLGIWNSPKCLAGYMLKMNPSLDYWRKRNANIIETNGQHFSYLGSPENISKKIASTAHIEFDMPQYNNLENIKKSIENHVDIFGRFNGNKFNVVQVDESYPKEILNNLDYWRKYIV